MGTTDGDETVRIEGFRPHECAHLLSAAKAEFGEDSPQWRAVHSTHVVAERDVLCRLEAAARRLAVREWDTTLYRAAQRIDDGL